jgi:predicted membrane channel-forming protein YqfA (hemolysin III family)
MKWIYIYLPAVLLVLACIVGAGLAGLLVSLVGWPKVYQGLAAGLFLLLGPVLVFLFQRREN